MKSLFKIILYSLLIAVTFENTTVFAASASLYVSKPSKIVHEGDTFTVGVKVQSTEQSINAISGVLAFTEDTLRTVSISRDASILNIWTRDPNVGRNQITFEGVILNPGFQGGSGTIFNVTFEAKKSGRASISFREGALLANDGLGTNIIGTLSSIDFNIVSGSGALDLVDILDKPIAINNQGKILALPVITEYSLSVNSKESGYLKGKGEPNALTKIAFQDVSHKSFGEQFMDFIQSKKKKLGDTLVKNNEAGAFEYVMPKDLIAGVYNATPFLVDSDKNISKPGLGVQVLVTDSKIVKQLIVFINILILLIPIVGLIMLIYFIPWYSSRRMRILKRKMGLEEEKIEITAHQLERQDQIMSNALTSKTDTEKKP